MSKETFWDLLDKLVEKSKIVIEIKKDITPKNNEVIFPTDYGYLDGTSSNDGEAIDVFIGTDSINKLDAILCTIDLMKRDSEIKLLIGCTEEEKIGIVHFYENYPQIRGLLIKRNDL